MRLTTKVFLGVLGVLVAGYGYLYAERYLRVKAARDNWLVAMLTLGEGYHSFHHRFPSDFRNGIRWYQWDPTKWLIRTLRTIGLASDLRSATPPQIERASPTFHWCEWGGM